MVPIEEQVAIFLMTIGQSVKNQMVANQFQQSGETIRQHFEKLLKDIVSLGKEVITPPTISYIPSEVVNNP